MSGKCKTCGAPARHMPPDGDFRYDPPLPRRARLFGPEAELIGRIVVPTIEQRSREPGDAWDQAAAALRSILPTPPNA